MLPNLTRNQAIERAALVTVDNYTIVLDLTDGGGDPGETTFRSTTTVEFEALPGADTYLDLAADVVHSAVLNGLPIDVSGYDESTGIPLRGLAKHNTLVVDADCRYSNTGEGLHRFVDPVDGEVYLYSQFETADAKRMFACFDQPDIKATFDVTVTAPAHWQVISNGAPVAVEDERRGQRPHLRHHPADEHLPGGADRRAVRPLGRRLRRRARRDPAGPVLPVLACRVHGRRAVVHRDQAGLRLLSPQLRGALRLRQVRPAVRARVQRRRDGERRRGDLPRGLRLPSAR